ncbi:Ni/Fe-hydrogenase, b-type cytochrome subunit [Phorcysia thermohydrogeniphila]|uniref:Ni/Fe-hydrogenase 1 B-type cytochrome subunit n=1 Tax=Phorcysia thermohydrogeniphila TaxID=936138 RepID=A0A4R1GQ05_9BACT|nr:Ni/Fe-hydrogenase, b-type cytochrome subunit [Phorcysia thermohydrogeniphila]TCK06592.1 Ni/Fe-hydrogenase 1 B-type cytochrome subunit [Phorcysia thermohydrogeniphila]
MAVYEKKYVWSILLRLFHWSFALSIFTLIVTGLYINWPWTNTWMEGSHQFTMATMRWIHFIAGMIFTCAVILRLYLWFFGNKYERLTDFLPINGRNVKNLFSTLLYYAYLTNEHEERAGHNALAGTAYFFTIILAVIQAITGLYLLYPESNFFGSLGSIFGTQQEARFIHHLINWYFAWFILVHLYIVVWNSIRNPEGLVSSIFDGHKFLHKK